MITKTKLTKTYDCQVDDYGLIAGPGSVFYAEPYYAPYFYCRMCEEARRGVAVTARIRANTMWSPTVYLLHITGREKMLCPGLEGYRTVVLWHDDGREVGREAGTGGRGHVVCYKDKHTVEWWLELADANISWTPSEL